MHLPNRTRYLQSSYLLKFLLPVRNNLNRTSKKYRCLGVSHEQWPCEARAQIRTAKTISRRRVKDLEQGIVKSDAVPALKPDDVPQYPTVLQGVKNNMIKFDTCVVLTRVGNFYELYFEHAEEYGPLLGLKVSSRKTIVGQVAMAGFPVFQLDRFLKILVNDHNKYVAISEEFPTTVSGKVKSGGLLFDRRVARIVTPGTLIDEKFLDPHQNNFLLSLQFDDGQLTGTTKQATNSGEAEHLIGLAWLDLSTGDFFTQTTTASLLPSLLMRIGAREILLSPRLQQDRREELSMVLGHAHDLITSYDADEPFQTMSMWNSMLEGSVHEDAEAQFTESEKLAGHRLLGYVRHRLQDLPFRLQPPKQRHKQEFLAIDRSSLRGLEILETSRDGLGKGSLFHAVRRTVTNSGARLLRDRLTSPSASLTEINARLDLVNRFCDNRELQEDIVYHLKRSYDVQRLVQKFTLNKGDADDMLCLAKAIVETAEAYKLLERHVHSNSNCPSLRETMDDDPIKVMLSRFDLSGPLSVSSYILGAIDEDGLNQKHRLEENEATDIAILAQEVVLETDPAELPALPKVVQSKVKSPDRKEQDTEVEEPWIMRRDASTSLSVLHDSLDLLRMEKITMMQDLRSRLSAPTLSLKWTPGLGHICHIKGAGSFNRSLLDAMNARMVSSTKSTRSFYLTEWSRLGSRMDQARKNIRAEEQRIFGELRQAIIKCLVHLRRNAAVMDELDVATGFAVLACQQGWTRPVITNSTTHKVVGGRHPTVKLGLEEQGRSFVANDLFLGSGERVWLVTGPNMAGKSTFLRQNALITILAQVGSYVPAEYAEIGLVDQVFSRVGAADDLFRDQSTFMVEMLETAAILKHSTARSFVIMDEVGRGTTPEDGTAVSFASLHHLYHINKCRTLFATHYHALVDMTEDWRALGRYCTDIKEDGSGSFSFVHKLRAGVNRQSHALKIAKLAGLPDTAIQIAKEVLLRKESVNVSTKHLHDHIECQKSSTATAAG